MSRIEKTTSNTNTSNSNTTTVKECTDLNDLEKERLKTTHCKTERGWLGVVFGISDNSYMPIVGFIVCLLICTLFVLLILTYFLPTQTNLPNPNKFGTTVYIINQPEPLAKTALILIVPIITMGIGLICNRKKEE